MLNSPSLPAGLEGSVHSGKIAMKAGSGARSEVGRQKCTSAQWQDQEDLSGSSLGSSEMNAITKLVVFS